MQEGCMRHMFGLFKGERKADKVSLYLVVCLTLFTGFKARVCHFQRQAEANRNPS
jgi:hypothetical protein